MINRIFFEGRCLLERKGNCIYDDDLTKGKLAIYVATFLNTRRNPFSKITKTFLFLGNLAVWGKQNFTKDKFFILEASFQRVKGIRYIRDKENPNYSTCVKGENLVVQKIYRSYRTYAKEETTEIEKNLKQNSNTKLYKTSSWEMLAKKDPIKILTKDTIKKALESLGIYELGND